MPIVIDTNALASVFNGNCSEHDDYKPVANWIFEGDGCIVYGGSKYKKELKRANLYLGIINELRRIGKVKEIDHSMVDEHEKQLKTLVISSRFNDAHLIAIFRVSRCRLLCSNDRKGDKFIKDETLYLSGQKPPSIYRNKKHKRLLCKNNIVQLYNVV